MADLPKQFCIEDHLRERLGGRLPVKVPDVPQVIDEVPTPEYQYAAAFCETLDPDEIPHLEPHKDEDSARRIVRYTSRQYQRAGAPDKSKVMRRRIYYGPWEVVDDD